MKRFLTNGLKAAFGPLFLCGVVWGSTVSMDGPMTDSNAEVGVAGEVRQYLLNLDDHNIDYVSAQVVVSSGNYTQATFNDGRASTFTVTIVTPASLSTAAATGYFTAVSTTEATGVAGSAVVVFGTNNGTAIVKITGPPGGLAYYIGGNVALGYVSSNTASNFSTAVNLSSNTSLVTASQSGTNDYVTLTCMNTGTACNSYAVTSSSTAQVSTAAFSGGTNPVSVTVGGYVFRAGSEFVIGASTATMASNLAALIYASSATYGFTASTSASVGSTGIMYTTATTAGKAGNLTLASSNQLAISTSGPNMTGGTDNAYLCINGTCLYANKHWYPTSSAATTADSLYAAINSSFTSVVTSTETNGVIYTTSTAVGTGTTYVTFSSSQTPMTISPYTSSSTVTGSALGAMYGGTNSSYTIRGTTIKIPSHGFPNGLKVSISSTTGNQQLTYSTSAVGGTDSVLSFGSTYYVIPVDANTISLALTSTGAVAGTAVVFSSSRTPTTADVWTVYIATPVGASSYGWWESDNGVDYWKAPSTSTMTFTYGSSFVYPSSFTYVDFGNITAKWLKLIVAPPATSGAIVTKTTIHGKSR
jgi:hypothetical protein